MAKLQNSSRPLTLEKFPMYRGHRSIRSHAPVSNRVNLDDPLCTRFSCLLLSTNMDAAEGTPASKKGKMENGDSYIPTQCDSNGDGTSNLSLIFSLLEQQGELVKSLGPFQVRNVWLVVVQVGGWLVEPFGCSVVAGHHSTMASLWLHVQCQAHFACTGSL